VGESKAGGLVNSPVKERFYFPLKTLLPSLKALHSLRDPNSLSTLLVSPSNLPALERWLSPPHRIFAGGWRGGKFLIGRISGAAGEKSSVVCQPESP
jgi:hypothetical protein